jgi:hypothetical protein
MRVGLHACREAQAGEVGGNSDAEGLEDALGYGSSERPAVRMRRSVSKRGCQSDRKREKTKGTCRSCR